MQMVRRYIRERVSSDRLHYPIPWTQLHRYVRSKQKKGRGSTNLMIMSHLGDLSFERRSYLPCQISSTMSFLLPSLVDATFIFHVTFLLFLGDWCITYERNKIIGMVRVPEQTTKFSRSTNYKHVNNLYPTKMAFFVPHTHSDSS
jgi:hypothetical protein